MIILNKIILLFVPDNIMQPYSAHNTSKHDLLSDEPAVLNSQLMH